MHNKRPFLYACQKSSIMVKQAQGCLKCLPQILFLIQSSLSKKMDMNRCFWLPYFQFHHALHTSTGRQRNKSCKLLHVFSYIPIHTAWLTEPGYPYSSTFLKMTRRIQKMRISSSSHLVTLPHCNIISVFTVTGLTCRISRWQWVWLLAEYCKRKEFAVSLTSCDELSVSPPLSFLSFFLRNISSSYGRKVFYLTFAYTQWVS